MKKKKVMYIFITIIYISFNRIIYFFNTIWKLRCISNKSNTTHNPIFWCLFIGSEINIKDIIKIRSSWPKNEIEIKFKINKSKKKKKKKKKFFFL